MDRNIYINCRATFYGLLFFIPQIWQVEASSASLRTIGRSPANWAFLFDQK